MTNQLSISRQRTLQVTLQVLDWEAVTWYDYLVTWELLISRREVCLANDLGGILGTAGAWYTCLMGNYLNYFTHTVGITLDKGYFMGYTY